MGQNWVFLVGFFGCRGVVGFNGCCFGASSGVWGFNLLMIEACRGGTGFICPLPELWDGLVAPRVFPAPSTPVGPGPFTCCGYAGERFIAATSMHAPIAAAMIVGRIQPSWFAWSGLHMRTELMCSG